MENNFMRVEDVAKELGISKSYAYKIVQKLNADLRANGLFDHLRPERIVMAVYKEDKTNTWRVLYRYVDWTGEKKQTQKRGFKTKRKHRRGSVSSSTRRPPIWI